MSHLRRFLTLIVALALANYGAMATASAHTHDHDGFHQVHPVSSDGFDFDHHAEMEENESAGLDQEEGLPSTDHTETGFHSHSTPQFGPHDAEISLAFILTTGRASLPDPGSFVLLPRDRPPFKPPRTSL